MVAQDSSKGFGEISHFRKISDSWTIEPRHDLFSPKTGLSK